MWGTSRVGVAESSLLHAASLRIWLRFVDDDPMVEVGVEYFVTYLPRAAYDPTPVERFAREVIPNVG